MEAIYNIRTYHYYLLCNNHWLSSQRASNNSSLCWPVWWHFSIHPNNLLYVHLIRIVVSLSSSNQHRRHSLVDFVWCDIAVITSEFYHSFLQISQFCRLSIKIKSSWKNPEVILRKLCCEVGDVLLRYIIMIILIKKYFKHFFLDQKILDWPQHHDVVCESSYDLRFDFNNNWLVLSVSYRSWHQSRPSSSSSLWLGQSSCALLVLCALF